MRSLSLLLFPTAALLVACPDETEPTASPVAANEMSMARSDVTFTSAVPPAPPPEGWAPDDWADDDGYCLVNEDHIPVFAGLVAVRLTGRTLRLRLTDEATRAWATRSATYTVRLHLNDREIEQLRVQLRRLFSLTGSRRPSPELDLG